MYSNSWEAHLAKLDVVFGRLANASLTLNLAKCEFAKAVVTYLGKRVRQGQVEAKVCAIVEFATPTNKCELQRFLGMAGYYRGFCRNFAAIVSPLTDLLSTSRKFVWTSECMCAFNAAKDLLCTAPVLSAPNFITTIPVTGGCQRYRSRGSPAAGRSSWKQASCIFFL